MMQSNHVSTALGTRQGQMMDSIMVLSDLIQALGFDPHVITVKDLQAVADKLSTLVNKEPKWGWRYLRNVLNGQLDPSRKLMDAMMRLGAVIDSTPIDLAKSERVSIQALGHVRPGSLVLSDSRPCANPGCRMEFVPRTPNQRCHSRECAKVFQRLVRIQRKGDLIRLERC